MTQNSDSEGFGPISDLIMELPKAPGLSLEVSYLDWGLGHTCLAPRERADKNPALSTMQLLPLDQTRIWVIIFLEA